MSLVEVIGAVTSLLGIYLGARRSVLTWPIGMIGIALYGWIFFDAKLYSDMLLQGVFAASQFYGWANWKRNVQADDKVRVGIASLRELVLGVVGAAIGAVALGAFMAAKTDAAAPWLDASLTCLSLTGQLWTARRLIQSWYLWLAVDLVYVGLFIVKDLRVTAALYGCFVILCFYGIRGWRSAAAAEAF